MNARLSLKTQLKASPQLLLASTLLRVSGSDLEQLISRELADNPVLELVKEPHAPCAYAFPDAGTIAGRLTAASNHALHIQTRWNGEQAENRGELAAPVPVIDTLAAQLTLLVDQADRELAIALLHALDDQGYLRTPAEELAAELDVECATIARLIPVLHELEPPGIGARDICECFLIQCRYLESQGRDCGLVRRILTEAWQDFAHQRWSRAARRLHVPTHLVEEAWRFVYHNLYPYPLSLLGHDRAGAVAYTQPDLLLHREVREGCAVYAIEIPGLEEYELRIGAHLAHLEQAALAEGEAGCILSTQERAWIQKYTGRAHQFMTALEQRWITLRRIAEYLVRYHYDFLEHGALHLKPLTRARVAAELGCHESTISRAIQEKHVQLPGGRLMALSDFFDASLAAKEAIRQILSSSPHRLSDQELADRLCHAGHHLARRTVAKYREQLDIPNSHRRPHGQSNGRSNDDPSGDLYA
jgi:RNA polymerase sigma-54 factor